MGRRERREDRERERERTPSPEIIEKKKASKKLLKILYNIFSYKKKKI